MPAWATSECLYNSRKNPRASPKTFGMTRMTPGIESCLNSKGMVGCSRTSSEGLSEGIAHCADVPDSIIVPGLLLVYYLHAHAYVQPICYIAKARQKCIEISFVQGRTLIVLVNELIVFNECLEMTAEGKGEEHAAINDPISLRPGCGASCLGELIDKNRLRLHIKPEKRIIQYPRF